MGNTLTKTVRPRHPCCHATLVPAWTHLSGMGAAWSAGVHGLACGEGSGRAVLASSFAQRPDR